MNRNHKFYNTDYLKNYRFVIVVVCMLISCNSNQVINQYNAKLVIKKIHDGTQVTGAVINGEKEGLWTQFDSKGRLSLQEIFVHNKETGETIGYYDDGKTILDRGYLINGRIAGEWISYYSNGKIAEKGSYNNGNRTGVWEYYLDNGWLNKKVEYIGKNEKIILDNHLEPPTPADERKALPKIDSNNRAFVK
jgi:antitoxin component YwqK of YwqJK toxin-antitoxin module